MTGKFETPNPANITGSAKRELSKSTIGVGGKSANSNNLLEQMGGDDEKKVEPTNAKNRMTYMSKLGIGSKDTYYYHKFIE